MVFEDPSARQKAVRGKLGRTCGASKHAAVRAQNVEFLRSLANVGAHGKIIGAPRRRMSDRKLGDYRPSEFHSKFPS